MEDNKVFGIRLKSFRKNHQLSVREVATKIGVPASTYREWEYGRAISGNPYVKIAKVFNISIVELMTGKKTDEEFIIIELKTIEDKLLSIKQNIFKMGLQGN